MWHDDFSERNQIYSAFLCAAGLASSENLEINHCQLTRLSWEDAHETRKEGVDSTQHFGIATGHARSDAPLERLEVSQDGWGLQHCQQEAENLQSCADVGDVRLGWLLLRGQKGVDTISGRSMKHIFFVLLLKQIEILGTF